MRQQLNHARRDAILHYVARDMGFNSVDALLASAIRDDLRVAVCVECYTQQATTNCWCCCCQTDNVQSVLMIGEVL